MVASIFVNPLQFGAGEDLDRYPRQETDGCRRLEQAGCDLLWVPTAQDMYPAGFATTVSVGRLGERWEGEARPGHFDGVATVVAKLLTAVRPDVAVFGEKDFQQLAVIRRLATDLELRRENRRPADRARRGRPRPVVAQRLSFCRGAPAGAGAAAGA